MLSKQHLAASGAMVLPMASLAMNPAALAVWPGVTLFTRLRERFFELGRESRRSHLLQVQLSGMCVETPLLALIPLADHLSDLADQRSNSCPAVRAIFLSKHRLVLIDQSQSLSAPAA